MSRNICLYGMMGVGKTTVGRRLAKRLGRGFVDTDELIVKRAGRPIPSIFAEDGEAYFRALEHQSVRDVAAVTDLVVSLGGGAVMSDANVAELLLSGVLIELQAPVDVLVERLEPEQEQRPLLEGDDLRSRIEQTLAERRDRYAEVADLTIDASPPPAQVVEELLAHLLTMGDVLTPSEHEQVMT